MDRILQMKSCYTSNDFLFKQEAFPSFIQVKGKSIEMNTKVALYLRCIVIQTQVQWTQVC